MKLFVHPHDKVEFVARTIVYTLFVANRVQEVRSDLDGGRMEIIREYHVHERDKVLGKLIGGFKFGVPLRPCQSKLCKLYFQSEIWLAKQGFLQCTCQVD
jgi:hypothetical protein